MNLKNKCRNQIETLPMRHNHIKLLLARYTDFVTWHKCEGTRVKKFKKKRLKNKLKKKLKIFNKKITNWYVILTWTLFVKNYDKDKIKSLLKKTWKNWFFCMFGNAYANRFWPNRFPHWRSTLTWIF